MAQPNPPTRLRLLAVALGVSSLGLILLLVFRGVLAPVVCMPILAVLLAWLYWQMRAHVSTVLLVVLAAMLAATLVSQPSLTTQAGKESSVDASDLLLERWSQAGPFDERLPVVIHLVFDAMMSPGGISEDLPGGAESRQLLYDVGRRHSLRTFDSVYSRQAYSRNALWNLMTQEYLGRWEVSDLQSPQPDELLVDNAYFDAMAVRGYRTVVFQTRAFPLFCDSKSVRLCETFESFDPAWRGSLDTRSRKAQLWQTLLRGYGSSFLSRYGQKLLSALYGLENSVIVDLGIAGRFDVQLFPDLFRQFSEFVAGVPRGTHVFAHFMVPHSPYLLSDRCVVEARPESSGYDLARRFPLEAERLKVRKKAYAAYFSQLNCVARSIDGLMRKIEQVDSLADARIIMHGDHGSRIALAQSVEEYERSDFLDNHSTYLAVRAAGVSPGLDCEFDAWPRIVRRYLVGSALPGQSRVPLAVLVSAEEGGQVEAAMPRFGCAAGAP